MTPNELIARALAQPKDAIYRTLSQSLAEAFPEHAYLETEDDAFSVQEFAHEGQCEMVEREDFHQQWNMHWDSYHDRIAGRPYTIWSKVRWQGHEIEVVTTGVQGPHFRATRHFVLAESSEMAEAFFEAVCRWCSEVRGEILVFNDGCWSKSRDLYESVRNTSLDTLILPGNLKATILDDFQQFFACRETYARYGIPWKRGVLFIGPPGNGKTHTIKGLLNVLDKACLYVRSFKSEYVNDHRNIHSAFQRARASAPCLFVLEDLDSLVDDENRSYFLNELDGFEANEGILTIATSNHPERLDPAILDRPSRFDRKYTFDLPEIEERKRYLKMFGGQLEPDLQLTDEGIESVASETDEFSYAYLKELYLSAMMEWIAAPGEKPVHSIMHAQSSSLREQMRAAEVVREWHDVDDEHSVRGPVAAMIREERRRRRSRFSRR